MIREGDVGQVVVPDRVVQAERFIALAPAVAGTLIFLNDNGGDFKAFQSGP